MNQIPDTIKRYLADKQYTLDTIGMSGAQILLFPDQVLKIQSASPEAEREVQMMEWCAGKLPVPRVLAHMVEQQTSYLLMTRAKGVMSCDGSYMEQPEVLTEVLADGLKRLWQVDTTDCPCHQMLAQKLKAAEQNVRQGLVDLDNVEPDTFGPEGFADSQALLDWLYANQPEEELVLSHGDFCLPNVFGKGNQVSGYIDLGRAGVADKWQDIALCYRSLRDNYGTRYGGTPDTGFCPELLFAKLGIEPDWEKIRYYMLLDELF